MNDEIPTPRNKAFQMMGDFIPVDEVKLGKFFAVLNDTVEWHSRGIREQHFDRETVFCTLSWFVAVLRSVPQERLATYPESIARLDEVVLQAFGNMRWEDHAVHQVDLKNAFNRFSWHMHVDIVFDRIREKLSKQLMEYNLYPGVRIAVSPYDSLYDKVRA